jgi:hypothetical protein
VVEVPHEEAIPLLVGFRFAVSMAVERVHGYARLRPSPEHGGKALPATVLAYEQDQGMRLMLCAYHQREACPLWLRSQELKRHRPEKI